MIFKRRVEVERIEAVQLPPLDTPLSLEVSTFIRKFRGRVWSERDGRLAVKTPLGVVIAEPNHWVAEIKGLLWVYEPEIFKKHYEQD